jgi:hypothetical protein
MKKQKTKFLWWILGSTKVERRTAIGGIIAFILIMIILTLI